jgi:hypothetical protein
LPADCESVIDIYDNYENIYGIKAVKEGKQYEIEHLVVNLKEIVQSDPKYLTNYIAAQSESDISFLEVQAI